MKPVYRFFYIALIGMGISCQDSRKNESPAQTAIKGTTAHNEEQLDKRPIQHSDTTIKFLWRAKTFDESLNDSVSTIFINEVYCKQISDPERAALGYVATFIGNECWWDGEANEDRSNLKCKILSALNLGYQCSETHLGFLRTWFREDKTVLSQIANCPTTPYTATFQETFDEIQLTRNADKLTVNFKANGMNLREKESWNWNEKKTFKRYKDHIQLIATEKSKVKRNKY